jgi:hypothetical protein
MLQPEESLSQVEKGSSYINFLSVKRHFTSFRCRLDDLNSEDVSLFIPLFVLFLTYKIYELLQGFFLGRKVNITCSPYIGLSHR